jgi:hypothetical protein
MKTLIYAHGTTMKMYSAKEHDIFMGVTTGYRFLKH